MVLYRTIDTVGYGCIHDCSNEEVAKQAHLFHYGLMSINFSKVEIVKGNIEPCFDIPCLSYIEEVEHKIKNK